MTDPYRPAGEILDRLAGRDLIERESIPAMAQELGKHPPELPWILQLFMTLGAWLATGSFIAFFGILGVLSEPIYMIAWGSGIIAVAVFSRRKSDHPFVAQVCLALSVSGHILVLAGLGQGTDSVTIPALVSVVAAAALYRWCPDKSHRFLSVAAASFLSLAAALDASPHGIHGVVLAQALLLGALVWPRHLPSSLEPLRGAIAVALLVTLWGFSFPDLDTPELPSRIIAGAGLVLTAAAVAKAGSRVPWALSATLFSAIATPGMSAGLAVAFLGAHRRDAKLEGLGTVFFPAFLFAFYYTLESTLLEKSLVLMGSGALLLIVAWFVSNRARAEAQEGA